MALSIIISLIFLVLSIIHFNWAFGGTWGFINALPTTKEGIRVLNPRKIDSVVVGLVLLLFALFYLIEIELIAIQLPIWLANVLTWLIPIILLARVIGDFKYVGFFKKITATTFARLDSIYYSPLCLFLGIATVIIAIFS